MLKDKLALELLRPQNVQRHYDSRRIRTSQIKSLPANHLATSDNQSPSSSYLRPTTNMHEALTSENILYVNDSVSRALLSETGQYVSFQLFRVLLPLLLFIACFSCHDRRGRRSSNNSWGDGDEIIHPANYTERRKKFVAEAITLKVRPSPPSA